MNLDGGAACVPVVLGDPTKPIQLELLYIGEGGKLHELRECAEVDLVEPPQGGQVVFVGARVTNIASCVVSLTGVLRKVDGAIAGGPDIRTVVIQPIPGRPGWGETSSSGGLGALGEGFAGVANVPACANVRDTDIQNVPHLLEASIRDPATGHVGMASALVMPRCTAADALSRQRCECLCSANYVNGKCNITDWDGGAPAPFCIDGGASDGAAKGD